MTNVVSPSNDLLMSKAQTTATSNGIDKLYKAAEWHDPSSKLKHWLNLERLGCCVK